MGLHQTLLQRCTVHDYSSEPVKPAAIRRAIQCALAAPNHKLTEPWRFVQVGPATRQQLAEVAVREKARKVLRSKGEVLETELHEVLREDVITRTRDKVLTPAVLLAVLRQRVSADDLAAFDFTAREDYAAVACAIQNLSLSLHEDGLGSKWSTGSVTSCQETYSLFGIDPSVQEIVGFLWVGVPKHAASKARRRLGVDEVLRHLP